MKGGRIIDYGQSGKGMIGSTTLRLGPKHAVFQAVALPDLRPAPEVTATTAMFVQTCGGRTGVPAPRRVRRAPFVQFSAPLAWTTLGLEIHADGSCEHHLLWASPFPPHWVYDGEGKLIKKSGLIDFSTWYRGAFGKHSPWGDQDPPRSPPKWRPPWNASTDAFVSPCGGHPDVGHDHVRGLCCDFVQQ